MPQNLYILSEQAVRDLTELARIIRQLGGPQAFKAAAQNGLPANPFRLGRIIAATATTVEDANNNPVQWTYEIEEVTKTEAGYTGWNVVPMGYTTTTARNFAEQGNIGTGRQMNGVDHDGADYPAGFLMRPVQVGAIVMFIYVAVAASTVEAWFWPPGYNGEDGTCEAP